MCEHLSCKGFGFLMFFGPVIRISHVNKHARLISVTLFTLCSNTHCSSQGCRLAAQPSAQINITNVQSQTRQFFTAFRVSRRKRWCVKSVKSSWKISTRTACLKTWKHRWREFKIVRVHGMHAMHGTGSAVTEIRLFPNLFRMFLLICLDSGVCRGWTWRSRAETLQHCNTNLFTTKVIAWFIELRKLRVLRDP